MDDIKLFANNKKELETLIYKDIRWRYRDGIWFTKMCHANNEKWQMTERIELSTQEKFRTL